MSETGFHFDRETTVAHVGDGTWSAHVVDHYNIGENPNGGYLMAIVLQALRAELARIEPSLDQPDPLTLTTHFLRSGVSNADALVTTEILKIGRSVTTGRATLHQEGKARVGLLAGFGRLAAGEDDREVSIPAPDLSPPQDCVDRAELGQGIELPLLSRVEVRLPAEYSELGSGRTATMAGWIRFVDGRPVDSLSLALFADAFPPSLFTSLGAVGWVPTLEMTVQVRRQPADGWVRAVFETDDLAGGRLIESGNLWDSRGQLVARCRQLGMLLT